MVNFLVRRPRGRQAKRSKHFTELQWLRDNVQSSSNEAICIDWLVNEELSGANQSSVTILILSNGARTWNSGIPMKVLLTVFKKLEMLQNNRNSPLQLSR